MKRVLLSLAFLGVSVWCPAANLLVNSQSDFNTMPVKIGEMLTRGEREVTVELKAGGSFVFQNNHLNFSGWKFPEAIVRFEGNGARISGIGSGEEKWSEVMKASGRIRASRQNGNEFVLQAPGIGPYGNATHILITEWYQSRIYKISEIRDGAVFFWAYDADELNMDVQYSGEAPRFRLLCPGVTPSVADDGANGKAARLLAVYGAEFRELCFNNIHFDGNCNVSACLLDFTDMSADSVVVRNCQFSDIHSNLVHVSGVSAFRFRNNYIHHCFRSGVVSDNRSADTRVQNNRFEDCGLSLDMTSCVDCAGTDYYVADNSFRNFGSRAISAGVYFKSEKVCRSSGIVERNVINYDSRWLDNAKEYTLMDTGAIYLTTFSDDAVIRFNRIFDYTGMKDNRGIFCDDGASGFTIYGNVVTGIRNSYSVDARRMLSMEFLTGGRKVNTDNFLGSNVLEGPVRFEGRLLKGNCRKDTDYLLCPEGEILPELELSGVSVSSADVKLYYASISEGIIFLSPGAMRRIRKWRYYPQMKEYFRKRI